MEQSVKLSISNEGLEYYRNRIQQSGQEKYDDVVQRKELLASKKISDIDYSYEIREDLKKALKDALRITLSHITQKSSDIRAEKATQICYYRECGYTDNKL